MKTIFIFLFLGFLNSVDTIAHSGDSIAVPLGTSPIIDGVNSFGEWTDACLIQLLTTGFYSNIYVKHSATHLFVAFDSPYASSVGIYIDKLHNAGTTPQNDDVWIHGSAGPFEFLGNGNSWIQQTNASNWNFVSSITNQISEFQISLSKLGITAGNCVLGILFSFIDWSMSHTDEITWPSGGYSNCGNPNSWANMKISLASSTKENTALNNKIKCYPNPAMEFIMLEGLNNKTAIYSIYKITGEPVKTGKLENNISKINLSNINPGIYFIKVSSEVNSQTLKFVKR